MHCKEVKYRYNGDTSEYLCEKLYYGGDFGILRYVIDRAYTVSGVNLKPGTVTNAFYWKDRPYNIYRWISPEGDTYADYFNIVDMVELNPETFSYRDLIVDVIVPHQGVPETLDREEIPAAMPESLRRYIDTALEQIYSSYKSILKEADRLYREVEQ